MLRKLFLTGVMVLAAGLSACGGDDSPLVSSSTNSDTYGSTKNALVENANVEIYGDSFIIGVGVSDASPLMRLEQYRPEWRVNNRAAGGVSLNEIIAGYTEPWQGAHPIYFPAGAQRPFAEIERSARFVVIQAGINDTLEDASFQGVENYENNLRYVVRILLQEGRVPVLTGLAPIGLSATPFHQNFNSATFKIAAEFGLEHAGWGEAYGDDGVGPDGLHASQHSSDVLTGKLIRSVDRAMELDAQGYYNNVFKAVAEGMM